MPLALMVIAWGAVSAGTSGITSTPSFYVVRFLLGLCEAGCGLPCGTSTQHAACGPHADKT